MKWISVEDYLPETSGKYLTVSKAGSMSVQVGISIILFKRYLYGGGRFMEMDWQKVTHWMPLPELPEEYSDE